MKVNTPEERRNRKRSKRLQKKLHVGEFESMFSMITFDLKAEFKNHLVDDERYFDFSDAVFDLVEKRRGHCGCLSISNGKVEICFDYLISLGDLRLDIVEHVRNEFNEMIEGGITVTDNVDSFYWEGWENYDDPFDILAVTGTTH